MRVLLITPPYHAGVLESAGSWPHLGFLYIANELRKAGYEVIYYDAMTKKHSYQDIRDRIKKLSPQVVASTAYTSSVNAAMETLKVAKKVNKEIITVIGGVHPTFCYEEILQESYIDFVIRWEGEYTFPKLLSNFEKGNLTKVKGIAFMKSGKLTVTEPPVFIEDLDSISPAWDLVDWEDYRLYFIPNSRVTAISTSRGCMNECGFCSQQKFWNKTYRTRSPQNVVKEICFLRDRYSVNSFLITDEYPTKDRERWEQILDLLIKKDLNIYLLLETCACDIVRDADILWKYRKAGVIHIYIGVEATTDERLDAFKKTANCEESKEAIRLVNSAGIISECSLILGMPDETIDSIEETLKLAMHYDPDFAHFLFIAPWPYADMYEDLKEYIEVYDYPKYNLVEPILKPKKMSRKEVYQAVIDCYKKFYMTKLPQWAGMKDSFKREILLKGMKAILDHSFLKSHGKGLGNMPALVKKYLKELNLLDCSSVIKW